MDAGLMGLRLFDAEFSASALVPVLTMAVELAVVRALIFQIRMTIRLAGLVSPLLGNETAN
jgi:hypothetical protein